VKAFVQLLRSTWRPIVAYWIVTGVSLLAFFAVVIGGEGARDSETAMILIEFTACIAGGVLFGQVLALLRVRSWTLYAFMTASWIGMGLLAAAMQGMSDAMAYVYLALFLFPWGAVAGRWSLATNRALFSAWLPFALGIAAILTWIEQKGAVGTWLEGQKGDVWDPVSLALLAGVLLLYFLYLAANEGHRLTMWRQGPKATLQPKRADGGDARTSTGASGMVLLVVFTLLVGGGTALIAPWLWRTGPADEGGGGEPEPPDTTPPPDLGWLEKVAEAVRKVMEAVQEASGALCNALAFFLLLALLVLAFWRPLKRLALLRHLRDPWWEVPPTRRIEQAWRVVEIALADVGVPALPGEDAAGLARRARPALDALSPVPVHGLDEAAAIADRVRFGLGVGANDVETITRFARWVLDTVWERMDDRDQVRALYRRL
jgi:hypothetical protein